MWFLFDLVRMRYFKQTQMKEREEQTLCKVGTCELSPAVTTNTPSQFLQWNLSPGDTPHKQLPASSVRRVELTWSLCLLLVFREVKNCSSAPKGDFFWDQQPPCLVVPSMVQAAVTETFYTHGGTPYSWEVLLSEKDTSCANTAFLIKFPCQVISHHTHDVPCSSCFTTYHLLPAPHKSMLWGTPCRTASETDILEAYG